VRREPVCLQRRPLPAVVQIAIRGDLRRLLARVSLARPRAPLYNHHLYLCAG
jgi:hypothetical protein